ncbi:hypothetical protein BOTNAR_0368g00040 [Botryotinia narcissicola]|uniref:Uncharacterized protein n=1 Tax=Botryotinia narcissicola TaxID=278944 RepID=A0A4Z1HQG7_9HELO|nr:hypothetical protein BOTNAR_0368g00040 [Botryotinia narcissicola]
MQGNDSLTARPLASVLLGDVRKNSARDMSIEIAGRDTIVGPSYSFAKFARLIRGTMSKALQQISNNSPGIYVSLGLVGTSQES